MKNAVSRRKFLKALTGTVDVFQKALDFSQKLHVPKPGDTIAF